MKTLVLEITNPETIHAIAETARHHGSTPEAFAIGLIESALLSHRPFEELDEPIAQSFDESGMTEEEFDALIEQERQAVWEEKHGR